MVLDVKIEIIVCRIHVITMVFVHQQLPVIFVHVVIHIQAPIVNKVEQRILSILVLFVIFSDYDHHHNDDYHSYCHTSTLWFRLCMYCNTMSDHCSIQSMCTKSMASFLIGYFSWGSSFRYSQNMGGCAIQNNMAQCFCSNYYTGYYCQFRM